MAFTFKKGNVFVVKASRYSKAKKGYLVVKKRFPRSSIIYVLRKRDAVRLAKEMAGVSSR